MPAEVETAINGHLQQIRHLPPEAQDAALMAEILSLADQYGARGDVDEQMMNEACDFVIASFPWLGVRELRTAFRWHASGKITTPAGEMYGGVFTVRVLGAILTAYNDKRKAIVAAYVDAKHAAEQEAAMEAKAQKSAAQFETNLLRSIEEAKEAETGWQYIPAAWYDFAMARNWITLGPGDKKNAWNMAVDEYNREQAQEKEDARKRGGNVGAAMLAEIEGKNGMDRTKAIAKKILVWQKLIQK